MRKTSGSIVCPSCNRLIDVNEPRCPYCNMPRPGLFGFAPVVRRLLGGAGDASRLITSACVALYVISLIVTLFIDPQHLFQFRGIFGIAAPHQFALYVLGMTSGVLTVGEGHWWTVLSAIYLHGSLIHIFFNMMWIRYLGPSVEDVYGTSRFYIIFTLSGAIGFIASDLLSGAPTIGASGSIFGLMAALVVHGRRTGHSLLTRQILTMAAFIFLLGFMMPAVNNIAHAGGFVGGWLAAVWTGSGMQPRATRREQLIALGLLVASVLAILASAITIIPLLPHA